MKILNINQALSSVAGQAALYQPVRQSTKTADLIKLDTF